MADATCFRQRLDGPGDRESGSRDLGPYGVPEARYIDEKLIEAVDEIDAVVNLGAGFDTRVYRLPTLADVPVWEIDQPENIGPKRRRLHKQFGAIPPHVNLVPIAISTGRTWVLC